MMGHNSWRFTLLAASITGLAHAQTLPGCWSGCATTAALAFPSCYYAYLAGPQMTSCYCGAEQSAYRTQGECCAVSRCDASDFSAGRTMLRTACAAVGQPDINDGSIVCPSTTIFYTGITDNGSPTTAAPSTAASHSTPLSPSATPTLVSGALTAGCESPTFTSVVASATTTSFPLIGCAPNNPTCCPYNINVGGAVSACPSGYSTISTTACCPSGWSIYTTSLGNNVPCVTTPLFDLTPNSTATGTSVVVISNRVFALQYQLSTATTSAAAASNRLSTGAKAGIGAGGGIVGLAILAGVILFLIRRHRRTPPAQTPPHGEIQFADAAGANELHSNSSTTKKPLWNTATTFKPGIMEVDSRPVQNHPDHGFAEVDGRGRPVHYELGS